MAIISTFELLAKRIGPPNGIPSPLPSANAPFRKLLQGYYLTIANPNERNLNLRLQAIIPRLKTGSPFTTLERELVGGNAFVRNHVYAYDRTGCTSSSVALPREALSSLNLIQNKAYARVFQSNTFNLKEHQTGIFNILPKPEEISNPFPQVEIRGYTKIVQVKQLKWVIGPGGIIYLTFVNPPPVDLLFTPEIRGTFIDDNFNPTNPSTAGLDFDQANYALPTSTGAAKIKISESVYPWVFIPSPDTPETIIDLTKLIDFEKLTGKLNYMKEFVLDNKSMKLIEQSLKREKLANTSLKSVAEQVQKSINNLHFKTTKKRK